jgi:TolA-binding protein
MHSARLAFCVLCWIALWGCSGDKAQELLETAQFEERQTNLSHAKQLYEDIVRLYPTSKEADIARVRLSELNK